MPILTITGVDSTVHVCECCGKVKLQKTIILAERETIGAAPKFLRYGVVCAAQATNYDGPDIVKQARKYEQRTKLLQYTNPNATPAYLGYNGR